MYKELLERLSEKYKLPVAEVQHHAEWCGQGAFAGSPYSPSLEGLLVRLERRLRGLQRDPLADRAKREPRLRRLRRRA